MTAEPSPVSGPMEADPVEPRTDIRSGLLRVVVALVLIATFWVGGEHDHAVHFKVVATYCVLTTIALVLAWLHRSPPWLSPTSIAIDAALVVTLFHEHLLGDAPREHDLTPTNIAVAFLLLLHAAMSLKPKAVLLFSAIFLAGWLSFAAISLPVRDGALSLSEHLASFRLDGMLAFVFLVTTIMLLMLMRDHNRSLARAVAAERQRSNMQRFFAPEVAAEIAQSGLALGLAEREASVMFVDLRSFTRFAEGATASELTSVLGEFRSIVSERVFARGGTIDKFIGDAVLAVFGVPGASPSDKANALACAMAVSLDLSAWAVRSRQAGRPALAAGIGLHQGRVLFGVIDSGCHAELTVLGDVVNVAQRLEQATKALNAAVVVSDAFADEIAQVGAIGWQPDPSLRLPGRQGTMGVFYLPRAEQKDADVRLADSSLEGEAGGRP